MRDCTRCQTEMKEGYSLRTEGGHKVDLIRGTGRLLSPKVGNPKLAICPKCGEISIYIDDTTNIK